MWKDTKIQVLVAGSGKTCAPFMKAVKDVHGVEIVCLLDMQADPSSIALAKDIGIPLVNALPSFGNARNLDVIVNASRNEAVTEHIRMYKAEHVIILEKAAARLVRLLTVSIRKEARFRDRYRAAKREIDQRTGGETIIIGKSPQMYEISDLIERVGPTPTTVLLLGETGVGKDLIARAIHQQSHLKSRPYISINCTALTSSLMESELFGYKKGAFTGAESDRKGLFEEADGGTLFLDEIGDMLPELQAKLLRFLQTGEIRPVGSTEIKIVDVRVIAATNRDLEYAMNNETFRRDLFYRFNTFTIEIPPLRERMMDIPYLVYHLITKAEAKLNKKLCGITDDAMECMSRYDWPGNVRELENVIERAAILCKDDVIRPEDLALRIDGSSAFSCPIGKSVPPPSDTGDVFQSKKDQVMENFEKKELMRFLDKAGGNVSEASRISGVPRRTFYRKMNKYGI
ncbi:MAG: sigma-54 dependent transcriptional regulator [Pseudodesulfovibrio sp.]|uniref:Sigma-54 factor interaction domain-containing protein n=1 Tax=Pseudodesulfovibrio aespoeensis (strain ATCC 700646 / DSM 10631 / Aspo-2) TaxID=643562 RepID=E6VVJ0_PSEA9|nr:MULTISPECIES: sigma-54 dependent transcriptional regulator [Pseudodesulfovibrio]ADU63548.1 sigma-54 factor interaction domain-containing protein [Pseudodesulfovibrio aespoeensis Aspo-2]MBV1764796.1 sigma-54 dependent transcriptional regulator [Pseudodesulfovibrio sp.]MBV1772167.1 sigma-54 dependent transcriptional regulator [Pseudodesulfovibrio sp.]